MVHAAVRDHAHDADLCNGLDGRLAIHDLDLRDRRVMRAVRDTILTSQGSLDVLINNAGYGLIGGVEQVELDRVRESFETNFFGGARRRRTCGPIRGGGRRRALPARRLRVAQARGAKRSGRARLHGGCTP